MRAWICGLILGLPALVAARPARREPPPRMDAACDDLPLGPLAEALDREIAALAPRAPLRRHGHAMKAASYAARVLAPLSALAHRGDLAALCAELPRLGWRTLSRQVVLTAYDSPTVNGSLTRDAAHTMPLYRRPPDLVSCPGGGFGKLDGARCVPYDTTQQILGGSLAGRGLELVWLADPYDALVLEVEGAGTIALPDGRRVTIGADGQNGHPYSNVTRLLASEGKLPPGPPPASPLPGNAKARAYFRAHPKELAAAWSKNPHYVFFREQTAAASGQLGALTPGRSVSIDPAVVPMGALLWIRAKKPMIAGGRITGWQPFERLVLGQDTGVAIRGRRRLELYWGDDDTARIASAGGTARGEAYLVVGP